MNTVKDKFVSHRSFVLTSVLGHSVAFEKGIPAHVPRECQREAIAAGCMPADEDDIVDMGDDVKKVPEMSEAEREEMLKMVLADMKARNEREEFTATGAPKVKVVATLAGFDVSAAEIGEIWTAMMQAE